jgi:hypothetical protein
MAQTVTESLPEASVSRPPHGSAGQQLFAAGLVGLSLAYLWVLVPRGWVPHDEGMIGQSAAWVLGGALPHIGYQEPYTGGLTWLHAAVFRFAGIDLLYPRWLLFAGATIAQALTYLILRRYLTPVGAALGAWLALVWSFPNYFAALPSWWVLICALACLWAFIRYVETGFLRYAAVAGLAAGTSILMKQTGLYVLVALVLALLYGGGGREPETRVWWPGRVLCAGVAVAALGLALGLLAARLALPDLFYLLLPIAACSRILATADGRHSWLARHEALVAPLTSIVAAAVPLACFIAPYVLDRFAALLNGLFVLPQKRVQFASFEMPPAYWILAGVPLVAMVMPLPTRLRAPSRLGHTFGAAVGIVGAVLVAASLSNAVAYQIIWQSVRGFAALLPVAACWLLLSKVRDVKQRWILFGCATMLAWTSLVQIPFSAPIYFCYVTPLAVIAAVALASASEALRRPAVSASAAVLLVFAVATMNRGYIYNLGFSHAPSALSVPLDLRRAHLAVSAADSATYHRVLDLIATHIGDGQLVAGPDCPEVYFLTGRVNPSGTLFDFFGDHVSDGWVNDLPGWRTASVVVLNHERRFSFGPSADLVAKVRNEFPKAEAAGTLEVRWR